MCASDCHLNETFQETLSQDLRLDLARAPQGPCAAYIDMDLFLEVRQLEVAGHREAILVWVVVVPLVAVWVDAEDVIGKRCVMVDDVAENTMVSPSKAS